MSDQTEIVTNAMLELPFDPDIQEEAAVIRAQAITYTSMRQLAQQVGNLINAVPEDRIDEMCDQIGNVAKLKDKAVLADAISRWMSIGAFYAHPPKNSEHPLASVLGVFEDEPLWDNLMSRMAKRRRRKTS